jgi:hypothetical protein
MADQRVNRLSTVVWLLTVAAGLAIAATTGVDWYQVAIGAACIVGAQLIAVPAPSGERLYLGVATAAAVPLLVDRPAAVAAIYAFGMAGSWLVFAGRRGERILLSSQFIAETLALAAFGGAFYLVDALLEGATFSSIDGRHLVAIGAAGLAWYVTRALLRSLVGLERPDISVRYLWLLALEDWTVIISLFVAGALFGFAWPHMGWWALPVAAMPYAFSHMAFVRYDNTKVTYRQTIRALAQIPEVAGLAPSGHASRTAGLALAVARELGLHPDDVVELEYAALVHDIGRITLNEPAILRAGYTDEDIARWGAQIVAEAPHLERVADYVRQQHRPYRRAGQERDGSVPIASKIIKVASAYDKAGHEMGLAPVDALEVVHRGSTYEFDPEVIASLRRVLTHRGLIPA